MSGGLGQCSLEELVSPFEFQYVTLKKWCKQTRTPFNLTLELTPLCNFRCPMCYVRLSRTAMEQRGGYLRAAQWLEITRQFADMGLMSASLSGGEPLLRPDFWEIYEGICRQGIYPTLFTNGALLDERAMERLVKFPPRTIKLSLYGASNETYRTMCGVENGFDKVSHAVDLILEAGLPMHLTTTLVRQNIHDLEGMKEFARCRKIVLEATDEINDSPRGAESDTAGARLEEKRIEDWSFEELNQHRHRRPQGAYDLCGGYGCTAVITWQGHLQVCALTQNEYVPLTEPYDIPAAWRTLLEQSEKLRLPPECLECPHAEFCSLCPGNLVEETGHPDRISKARCERTARIHECYLRKLAERETAAED